MPSVPLNSTSYVTTVFIQDSSSTTGGGKTGLAFGTSGLTCYYKRSNGTASVAVTLADITTLGTFVSGGFKVIDGTNMPGLYEFDPPDAALATGATGVTFYFQGAAGMVPTVLGLELTSNVSANVTQWNGTNVATPATAGIPDVNAKNINNVATTSVTTINAHIGSTQPVNYTGTGASALIKADMIDAAGTAVTLDANNALNVSAKYWAGTAITATSIPVATAAGAAGGLFIAGTNAATTVTTSFTTTFTGNLTGSVGSVTGAVGSVTGNVGGNVTGSVGSLTLSQALSSPRDISAIADGSITLNDALWSATCGAAGKETVVSTTYTVKTPSTGTTLRIFTLDSATTPTSRT